ncbi:hypothetical protein Tco_0268538 [Tanacetum coccineum]
MMTGKWTRMHSDCQRFNAIYKHLTRKSEENNDDHVENAKTGYMERYGNKRFQYVHAWNILKLYPKWDKAEPIDEDNLVELFDPDPRTHMCNNDIQTYQNAEECDDECVALANLIENLKLDIDENKKIQKTLEESNSTRDSCLIALQSKQTELETYKTLIDRTVDYDKLESKLNETLGLLAQKEIDIKEGLKLKAYEILVVKEKHDEFVKQSFLTKSHYEGLVKEKTKVITDLKLKEEKDPDKMISTENQLKFLNEIVYKRNQSIQPFDVMLALKGSHTMNDSFIFVHELKQEMHADLKYVESLENEIDKLEFDKAEFLNMYDILLQECVSNDAMCSYLHLLSDLDAHSELQCLYLH